MPSLPQPSARLRATLLASPTQASVRPSSRPISSRIVYRSAIAWQGWPKSVRPLITEQVQCSASSTAVWWRLAADHDHVDVLAQHAAEIGDALAAAEADVVAQEERAAAQVGHGRLEADAGAQRLLLEEQGHHAAGQQRLAQAAGELRLQVLGDGEDPLDLGRRQVGHASSGVASCRSPVLQHVGQDVAACVGLLFGKGHGGQQADHRAVGAIDQQLAAPGRP